MADRDGEDLATTERVLAAGGVSKRRRNLSNKTGGDRIRSAQSRSPKRRPGTPEPAKRVFSDESERETSDSETSRQRFQSRKDRSEVMRRTRSKERPPQKDTMTDVQDDFEMIRQMHKAKQFEENVAETKQEAIDSVQVVKELKEREVKELPGLILAPKSEERPKRVRPKTLLLNEEAPTAKPRSRSRSRPRKLSTSEEDDEANLALRGKLVLKPKAESEPKSVVRRRKIAKKIPEPEKTVPDSTPVRDEEEVEAEPAIAADSPPTGGKSWFFTKWFSKSEPVEAPKKDIEPEVKAGVEETIEDPVPHEPEPPEEELVDEPEAGEDDESVPEPAEKTEPKKMLIRRIFSEYRAFALEYNDEYLKIKRLRNRCASGLLLIVLFCGIGGFIFRFTEGTFESFYKCGVKRVKRDFIDSLWSYSQYMPQEDWKHQARSKLLKFENELHMAHEAGMTSYSGQKSWSFLNAVVYSLTVVTTIGYGHISPVTATGRAITVIYAIIGIPMFLILLADFGKLFTRAIKFLWAFVRRLYYTGSCRKVRGTVPVQDMVKGVQAMYDFARRSSQMPGTEPQTDTLKPPESSPEIPPETPAPSQFEIDDEFNLPISVAITILVAYILIGATIYSIWEEWSFFECFYFVFISMSTIGFGDFVPNHPMYMMASMVYLVFGLALTSMCINVVQEKLSDTFKQASAKIGATIGFDVEEEGMPEQEATESQAQPEEV